MAYTSTGLVAGQAPAYRDSKALQLMSQAFAWVAEQRRISRTAATLSSLSDSTLRDIGIERGDIENVARHGRGSTGSRV